MGVCYRYEQQINDLNDNELEPSKRAQLQAHLDTCSHCREYLERSQMLKASMAALPRFKTSETFDIVLREKLRNEIKHENRYAGLFNFDLSALTRQRIPAFAAVIALLVISGAWIGRNMLLSEAPATQEIAESQIIPVPSEQQTVSNVSARQAEQPYIKMRNYVNVREQFTNTPGYIRTSNRAEGQQYRIESNYSDDSARVVQQPPSTIPLVRQANATVHF